MTDKSKREKTKPKFGREKDTLPTPRPVPPKVETHDVVKIRTIRKVGTIPSGTVLDATRDKDGNVYFEYDFRTQHFSLVELGHLYVING